MTAVTTGTHLADGLGTRDPSPAQTIGPALVEGSQATAQRARAVRSWPLLVLAAPAAAEVWSGWVGIAQKTGFGLVSPLPGILPSLHLDTSITLPVGVEAYAAYALRAWLASEHAVSARTRRFAKWSAICSFTLGMAGQVAYHLLAQAGTVRAPWAITTIVSCLPVLVLAMGTALAHMLRADAAAVQDDKTGGPATLRFTVGQASPHKDQISDRGTLPRPGPPAGTNKFRRQDHEAAELTTRPTARPVQPKTDQARLIARRLYAAGKPVSRRALRNNGVKGSNESLNALARKVKAELTGPAGPPPNLHDAVTAH